MTKTVFPAIEIKTRETQRRMIERFNRTVLHNEFPDGAKVMSIGSYHGRQAFAYGMKALILLSENDWWILCVEGCHRRRIGP